MGQRIQHARLTCLIDGAATAHLLEPGAAFTKVGHTVCNLVRRLDAQLFRYQSMQQVKPSQSNPTPARWFIHSCNRKAKPSRAKGAAAFSTAILCVAAVPAFELRALLEVAALSAERGFEVDSCETDGQAVLLCVGVGSVCALAWGDWLAGRLPILPCNNNKANRGVACDQRARPSCVWHAHTTTVSSARRRGDVRLLIVRTDRWTAFTSCLLPCCGPF